eukprot:GHVR01103333.1.p1 GENE.GHVR01103333.1~~GHVR01103333.1.p1  ORF type:complete len:180 (+),score=36.82 GHVR01103333.1:435-974(+)
MVISVGTNAIGCEKFKKTQGEVCECVPADSAEEYFGKFLKFFYQGVGAEKTESELKTLIKDKGGMDKAASLTYKMLNKYTGVIGFSDIEQSSIEDRLDLFTKHVPGVPRDTLMSFIDGDVLDLTGMILAFREKEKEGSLPTFGADPNHHGNILNNDITIPTQTKTSKNKNTNNSIKTEL